MSRVTSSMFCEDVRREIGGQATVVGVYSSARVCDFPLTLPIAYFLRITPLPPKDTLLNVEFSIDGEIIHVFQAMAPEPPGGLIDFPVHSSVVIDPFVIEIEGPATVRCEIKMGDSTEVVTDELHLISARTNASEHKK